jgi:hypothetical protein
MNGPEGKSSVHVVTAPPHPAADLTRRREEEKEGIKDGRGLFAVFLRVFVPSRLRVFLIECRTQEPRLSIHPSSFIDHHFFAASRLKLPRSPSLR